MRIGLALRSFPRLYAAASLKPDRPRAVPWWPVRFPRLYAAASLKLETEDGLAVVDGCFPRLYAAASLKLPGDFIERHAHLMFSAALCRGLIEAGRLPDVRAGIRGVFRGFMPRPH